MGRTAKTAVDKFLAAEDTALLRQCDVDHYRDRGPGGQKHNKSCSAVRLRHRSTQIIVTATEQRSQAVNKARALRRLREAIELNVRSAIDVETYSPSELLASCISKGGQLSVARRNQRYPAAACEVLDVLGAAGTRVSDAAKHLGISTANLTKFIRANPKMMVSVNQMRAKAGLRRIS